MIEVCREPEHYVRPSVTHPYHHRARAAAWSLRAALTLLRDRTDAEGRAIAAEQAAAADPIRSPVWGRRNTLGVHGDPTADAVDAAGAARTRTNRFADLEQEVGEQLATVARHLPPVVGDPLSRIETAIPVMSPVAAAAAREFLDRIDARIRRLLGEPDDRRFVPRVPCPACDAVGLQLRTSAPPGERVVECTTCIQAWAWTEMTRSVPA